ncbi:hypothetical protein [Streptomyces graminofaciens]|uniref:hypothetical protein n=1 Tax=Streptomyces graminofaciens TaxID=68212 RepID=UPI002573CF4A|nr:hypothetical protein [Streptomyces graminofaciens]
MPRVRCCSSCPHAERAATRDVLRAQALPQLREWITRAISADETWRLAPHQRYRELADGHLTHRDEM